MSTSNSTSNSTKLESFDTFDRFHQVLDSSPNPNSNPNSKHSLLKKCISTIKNYMDHTHSTLSISEITKSFTEMQPVWSTFESVSEEDGSDITKLLVGIISIIELELETPNAIHYNQSCLDELIAATLSTIYTILRINA
jgi:hypothetical protein